MRSKCRSERNQPFSATNLSWCQSWRLVAIFQVWLESRLSYKATVWCKHNSKIFSSSSLQSIVDSLHKIYIFFFLSENLEASSDIDWDEGFIKVCLAEFKAKSYNGNINLPNVYSCQEKKFQNFSNYIPWKNRVIQTSITTSQNYTCWMEQIWGTTVQSECIFSLSD